MSSSAVTPKKTTSTSKAASSRPMPTKAAPKKATPKKTASVASQYCQGACGTTGMTVRDMRCLLRCIGKPANGKRVHLEKRLRDKGPDFKFYGPDVYYPYDAKRQLVAQPLPAKRPQPRTPASGVSKVKVVVAPQPLPAVAPARPTPACAVALASQFDLLSSV